MTETEPPAGRRRGHPPAALTPGQVEVIRRRRRRKSPRSARPSLDALAAEFQVHPWTIWKAIHGRPPYAYKAGAQEPLPSDQRKAPHRKRRPGT